jgi:hypothetical protein
MVIPAFVFAHGVEGYDITAQERSVQIVYFKYSTGEPMAYARIKIFPPSAVEKNLESLISITNRNGLFSFVPDESGEWRIAVEDGMGHMGEITVMAGTKEAGAVFSTSSPAPAFSGSKLPLPLSAAAELSFIVNLFALWYFASLRKKGTVHTH